MSNGLAYTVNYTLTQYGVSWFGTQTRDVARFLAPSVKVPGTLGTYKRWDRGDAFQVDDTRRGLYQSAKTIEINGDEVAYKLESHALKIGIDDDELAGAGDIEAYRAGLRQSKTLGLLKRMANSHNKQVIETVNAAVPATTELGSDKSIGKWSTTGVDARTQLRNIVEAFVLQNGVYPNRWLCNSGAWNILGKNEVIQDLIQYNNVKELTAELLRQILGYDQMDMPIDIRHGVMPYNSNLQGIDADNKDMLGNTLYLFYAEESPSLEDITAVKTLNLAGDSEITAVESARDDDIQTEWLRVKQHKKVVVSAPSCIYRIAVS